jgi:hypothetical protein
MIDDKKIPTIENLVMKVHHIIIPSILGEE